MPRQETQFSFVHTHDLGQDPEFLPEHIPHLESWGLEIELLGQFNDKIIQTSFIDRSLFYRAKGMMKIKTRKEFAPPQKPHPLVSLQVAPVLGYYFLKVVSTDA